jgi:NAD(P)-dependent dehydrogenase (short-subunit alcohol dehydrogenase family)
MDTPLDGKVALITGGSRGIGKAIAAAYLAQGAQVMITSRTAETCEATANELGDGCHWSASHVAREDDAERVVGHTINELGAVDILVNNAATNPYAGPVIDADVARWDKTFAANVTGTLVWSQQAWHQHMKDNGGAIVNIASVGGYVTHPHIGSYNITKTAVIQLTKQLAAELSPSVRVNAVAPGLIKTDMARFLWEGENGEKAAKAYPLKKLGEVDDIANAALYLASDASGWITGHTIVVDGGGLISYPRT